MVLAAEWTDFLVAVGAVLTGAGALITAIVGHRSSRRKAMKECHDELTQAWAEAEAVRKELHRLRMEYPDESR